MKFASEREPKKSSTHPSDDALDVLLNLCDADTKLHIDRIQIARSEEKYWNENRETFMTSF